MVFALAVTLARPLLPVVTVAPPGKRALATVAGAAKVTLTPDTGLLNWSTTVATRALPKLVLTVVVCPGPEVTTMLASPSRGSAKLNEAGVLTPLAVAVTL